MATDFNSTSDLKRVRGLGTAKSGVHHWWLQRITAVALIPLSIWLLFFVFGLVHASYPMVLAALARPVPALLLIVFSICVFWHGMLGLDVIIGDYVHTRWLEVTLQIAVRFGAVLGALACIMAVLSVWLTGSNYY